MNCSPSRNTQIRTTGAHIHVGYSDHNINKTREIVKFMDLTFGLASIMQNMQGCRMSLYGRPGAFRPKPYGLEYRFMPSEYLQQAINHKNSYRQQIFISIAENPKKLISPCHMLYFMILGIINLVQEGRCIEDVFNTEQINIIRYVILSYDIRGAMAMRNTSTYLSSILTILEASGIFKQLITTPISTESAKILFEIFSTKIE